MRNLVKKILLIFVTVFWSQTAWANVCSPVEASKISASEIVDFYDSSRTNGGGSEMVIRLTSHHKGKARKQRFRILDNGENATLVYFLDPQQRGTRILSEGANIWFYSSRTRRAIKVPALQRVFGEASYGDLTQMVLSRDYIADQKVCLSAAQKLRISLTAKDNSATYAKVNLWVDSETYLPVQADYFVASGKHIKTAEFPKARLENGVVVLGLWILFSPQNKENSTTIETLEFAEKIWPKNRFTRRALESGR